MALISATITVDFIANYSGDHRVCWKVQGTDTYDCSTIINCAGGGNTCQAVFTAQLNGTSCDGDIVVEGYVQAACQDELSLEGRVPFQTNPFTPTVVCERFEVICDHVGIINLQIDQAGTQYQVGDVINFVRDTNDTETTDASATVASVGSNGEILSLDLTDGGSYQIMPTITITSTNGTGASLTAEFDKCPSNYSLGTDCADNNVTIESGLELNKNIAYCIKGGISTPPDGYIINRNGCCIREDTTSDVCYTYDITNNDVNPVNINFTACGGAYNSITVDSTATTSICAVDGSVDLNITNVAITKTTTC